MTTYQMTKKKIMKTKKIKQKNDQEDETYIVTTYQEKLDLLAQIHREIEKQKNEPFLLLPSGTVTNLARLSD